MKKKIVFALILATICIFVLVACAAAMDTKAGEKTDEVTLVMPLSAEEIIAKTPTGDIILGDVDGDGAVTNADVLMIYRYIYNPALYPLPTICDHTFGEWTEEAHLTCTTDGKITRTCTKCSMVENSTLKGGHAYEALAGSPSQYVCLRCGDTYKDVETFVVTFVDYDGRVLKTEKVESGMNATAPSDPTRSGYRFTCWDVAFNNITSDTTVTAQYIQQFTVTFKDYDGSTLKTQTVDKGSNATPPANPSRDGYEFVSWSGTYTNVTTNQVVTATYTQNAPVATHTVTFYDYDGTTVLGTSSVAEGKAATPPTNPTKTGATFLGWNGNYTNVIKNESVVAVFDDSKNVFTVESATGSIGDTVSLLVSIDGTVKTCGFDITIYYDNAILELVSYDSDLDLDVVVNTEYLDNGILLNFSAATEKTKSREIIELTFRIKDTTSDATSVSVEMTSVKEMDGSTIIDSTCEFVEGVVTIQ